MASLVFVQFYIAFIFQKVTKWCGFKNHWFYSHVINSCANYDTGIAFEFHV